MRWLIFFLVLITTSGTTFAAPDPKPTLQAEDFGRWERFRSARLSPTGDAVAYVSQRVDGKSELRVRRLEPDETWVIPWGMDAEFSEQGRWIAWRVTPSKEARKKLEKEKKPLRLRGELMELATGERRDLGEISKVEFDATGHFLAVHGIPDAEAKPTAPGGQNRAHAPKAQPSDLHVRDLAGGSSTIFGNVESFVWHEELALLAMIVGGDGERGNAVQVYNPATGRLQGLDHSASTYRYLVWREEGADLAVLRTIVIPVKESDAEGDEEDGEESDEEGDDEDGEASDEAKKADKDDGKSSSGADTTEYDLLAWRGLEDAETSSPLIFNPAATGLEGELFVTGDAEPSWSPDGTRLSMGMRQRDLDGEEDSKDKDKVEDKDEDEDEAEDEDKGKAEPEKEDLAGVQIWHTSDVRIIPQQQAEEAQDKTRTLLAVWDLDRGRMIQVGQDLQHQAEVLPSWTHATIRDESPYPWGNKFGRPYHDLWTVDLTSGERRKSLEKVRYAWPSAGGKYLLSFDGEHYWSLDLASGQRSNLTQSLETRFADTDNDFPDDGLEPPFGVGGWLEDDDAVLLYDEFDVWRIAPDGSSAVRMTTGASDQTVHRVIDLDEDEDALAAEDLYFALRDEWTEQRGFARWTPGGKYLPLVLEDKNFQGLQKAQTDPVSIKTLLYRRESRTDAPDLFVTDGDFTAPRVVAESNPFLAEYAWTRAELVE